MNGIDNDIVCKTPWESAQRYILKSISSLIMSNQMNKAVSA